MEHAQFGAVQFLQYLRRINLEHNREQQSDICRKLSEHLSMIFRTWCSISEPEMTFKVLELLTPCAQDNLFSVVMRKESLSYTHPFPFTSLPIYVQKILMTRKLDSLPEFYKAYDIVLDQGFLVLPSPQFFLFTFMAESTRKRETDWFESTSFFETAYNNPFLLLFNQYLQCLDSDLFVYFVELASEYLVLDISHKLSPAPNRHNCEMLLTLIYTLQKPCHLLVPAYRMINVNPSSLLITMHDNLYKYFKNISTFWKEGSNSYCCYIVEIWLQFIMPWNSSEFLESYLNSDVFESLPKPKNDRSFTGSEPFWEEYIHTNLLFYTDLFSSFVKLLCSEILFRPEDINTLHRLSSVYTQDSEGNLFSGHLSLKALSQMSKGGPLPGNIEKTLTRLGLNKSVVYPFNDSNIRATAENLIFKAKSFGYREAVEIERNWRLLLGVRENAAVENGKDQLKIRVNYARTLVNPWDKPLRSDEMWILYVIVKYLAYGIDLARKKEEWPPRTNLRFFASFTNLMFIGLVLLCLKFLIFR